jgi:hypothetical protein
LRNCAGPGLPGDVPGLPGFDLDKARQWRADEGKPEWFGEADLYPDVRSALARLRDDALRRCDLDLDRRTVRVRAAYVERSTGGMLLGPPKSRAGRRLVGIPGVIVPALREHLADFVRDEPSALVFPGQRGVPLRRSNFNKMSGWPYAVASIGAPGLHVHDLRHTGNQFAANSGAGLRDLMTRMGHDSERAALIYQHEARGADRRVTDAIDSHVQAERDQGGEDDGTAGALVPAG